MIRESAARQFSWAQWLQALLIALIGGVVGNLAVWAVSSVVGEIRVDALEVAIFSAIGALAGGVLYAALARVIANVHVRNRVFVIVCVVALVAYAFAPLAAMQAPYREGAQPFNVLTVIATELMHLISGGLVIFAFTRRS